MTLSNNYSLKTAKDQQRPCFICGKFSSSVLDAPDDFFFVCLSHTNDTSFCSISTTVSNTKTSEEKSEIELLKKESSELKGQLNKSETDQLEKSEEPKTIATKRNAEPVKVYKLHRSILYLREQAKAKKEKLNLLKSLK